jgi:hypothetical protein
MIKSRPGKLASIVDDLADYTSQVAMSLGVIETAELGRGLVQARVGSYNETMVSAIHMSFSSIFVVVVVDMSWRCVFGARVSTD